NADEAGGPGENNERKGSVRLKDLITDGFLIRTTVFVPADAVTRQTGAVSSDAMVMTLQKETVIAICYYTFKAYVKGGKGLLQIPSCPIYDCRENVAAAELARRQPAKRPKPMSVRRLATVQP